MSSVRGPLRQNDNSSSKALKKYSEDFKTQAQRLNSFERASQ